MDGCTGRFDVLHIIVEDRNPFRALCRYIRLHLNSHPTKEKSYLFCMNSLERSFLFLVCLRVSLPIVQRKKKKEKHTFIKNISILKKRKGDGALCREVWRNMVGGIALCNPHQSTHPPLPIRFRDEAHDERRDIRRRRRQGRRPSILRWEGRRRGGRRGRREGQRGLVELHHRHPVRTHRGSGRTHHRRQVVGQRRLLPRPCGRWGGVARRRAAPPCPPCRLPATIPKRRKRPQMRRKKRRGIRKGGGGRGGGRPW